MSTARVGNIVGVGGVGAPTFSNGLVGEHQVWLEQGNGHGSTNTKIRRFSVTNKNVGTAITYADSGTLGASFTINETGLYAMSYGDTNSGGASSFGITRNNATLTTSIAGLADGSTVMAVTQSGTSLPAMCAATVYLVAGDVIRPHTDGAVNNTGYFSFFKIAKVGV